MLRGQRGCHATARPKGSSPDTDGRPASDVVDEAYVEALSLRLWKKACMDLTAKEFLYALARLGGHQGRKSDRSPGWLVLWRGWMQLQPLVEGMLLAQVTHFAIKNTLLAIARGDLD
jgi:hypothetical protein